MATRRAATKTVATTENTTKETAPVKTTKKFEQNELIECRSLVQPNDALLYTLMMRIISTYKSASLAPNDAHH